MWQYYVRRLAPHMLRVLHTRFFFSRPACACKTHNAHNTPSPPQVDDYVDGKACGWYNYADAAAATVDGVWSEWNSTKNDEFLAVRCVHSGYFDYPVRCCRAHGSQHAIDTPLTRR